MYLYVFLMLNTAVMGFVWMSHHRNEYFNQEISSLDLDLGIDSTHATDPTESQVHLINVTEIVVIYVVPGGICWVTKDVEFCLWQNGPKNEICFKVGKTRVMARVIPTTIQVVLFLIAQSFSSLTIFWIKTRFL